jgi:hypothetical protein
MVTASFKTSQSAKSDEYAVAASACSEHSGVLCLVTLLPSPSFISSLIQSAFQLSSRRIFGNFRSRTGRPQQVTDNPVSQELRVSAEWPPVRKADSTAIYL